MSILKGALMDWDEVVAQWEVGGRLIISDERFPEIKALADARSISYTDRVQANGYGVCHILTREDNE